MLNVTATTWKTPQWNRARWTGESPLDFGYLENGMNADDPFQISGTPVIVGTRLISLDIVLGQEASASRLSYTRAGLVAIFSPS